jgi:uridine kinase
MHQIKTLLDGATPQLGTIKLIGIDGYGGSGKSTLANHLAEAFGAEIIHIDDFASFDKPVQWFEGFKNHVITPISTGSTTLSYPRSSWWPNHQPEPVENQLITPIMIVEGVRTLRSELRPYLTLSIFVSTPPETCLARGLTRDMAHTNEAEARAHWEAWLQSEADYMATEQPKEHADIVIDGTRPFSDQIKLD